MMHVHLIYVGEFSANYFAGAQSEYEKRLSGFAKVVSHPIKESPLPEKPAGGAIALALEKEATQILDVLGKLSACYKMSLCIEGRELSSLGLAQLMEDLPHQGYSSVAFAIGSSYGLSDRVVSACDRQLSFSKMTFPHQLMRVILTEQIYRAFSINAGRAYHK